MLCLLTTTISGIEDLTQEQIACLDGQEQQRLSQIKAKQRRLQFFYGRLLLRAGLKHYFGMAAADYKIALSKAGKPFLAGNSASLYFSLSHSGPLIICALSNEGEIGIDIEQQKKRQTLELLAARTLAVNEQKLFVDLETSEKQTFFYERWVLKEAYYKALGQTPISFNQLDFEAIGRPKQFKLKNISDLRWQFFGFELDSTTVGALAIHSISLNQCPAPVYWKAKDLF